MKKNMKEEQKGEEKVESVEENSPQEEQTAPIPVDDDILRSMTDAEMWKFLFEFSETVYWKAFQRFTRIEDLPYLNSLGSMDPFKEATSMSRIQGLRWGLYLMEQRILKEKENRKTSSL